MDFLCEMRRNLHRLINYQITTLTELPHQFVLLHLLKVTLVTVYGEKSFLIELVERY